MRQGHLGLSLVDGFVPRHVDMRHAADREGQGNAEGDDGRDEAAGTDAAVTARTSEKVCEGRYGDGDDEDERGHPCPGTSDDPVCSEEQGQGAEDEGGGEVAGEQRDDEQHRRQTEEHWAPVEREPHHGSITPFCW